MGRGKGEVRDRYGRGTGCLRDYKGLTMLPRIQILINKITFEIANV